MSDYIFPDFLSIEEKACAGRMLEESRLSAISPPELYTSIEQAVIDELAGAAEEGGGEVRMPLAYLRAVLQRARRVEDGPMEFSACYRILARRLMQKGVE